jgi:5-methyltetrahydropteroyltriglutamate--homocysteine methyltransferase
VTGVDPTTTPVPAGATILGFPRMGPERALKKLTERYWSSELSAYNLLLQARDLRRRSLIGLRDAGLDEVPCNDFSFYDHVLDTACMLGAIPERHLAGAGGARPGTAYEDGLPGYFAMARGTATVTPLEMTKWFDTNLPLPGPGARPGHPV